MESSKKSEDRIMETTIYSMEKMPRLLRITKGGAERLTCETTGINTQTL